eukprot:7159168-Prymnesium_polylepis.1
MKSLDDRAHYYDHDPAAPGSPRTERALHVRLREHARKAADAAISAERAAQHSSQPAPRCACR